MPLATLVAVSRDKPDASSSDEMSHMKTLRRSVSHRYSVAAVGFPVQAV